MSKVVSLKLVKLFIVNSVLLTGLLLFFSHYALAVTDSEFPGRSLYPSVPVISLSELNSRFDEVVVVDVRSAYEYETLRVKGAINIPLSSSTFVAKMRKLRSEDARPIIVYCNGKTCMKSYKAALKCAVNRIDNVHSFDAGIMDWARTYPDRALLLGKGPVDVNRLISKKEFNKHLLSPDAYGDKVRDRFQREALSIFVGRERRAYLDNKEKLDRYIKKAKKENRAVLVHDAAGKQVRWLQYYLKDKGLKNYYFMQGGVAAYYDQMKEEFTR